MRPERLGAWLAIAGPALVSLAIGAYQLALPDVFWGVHGADDGIHLAPALRFVHGAVPYRDFALVELPGLTWLMTPLAAIGDTRLVLGVARVVTVLVTAGNAALVALALRSLGIVPMLFAGLMLAVGPVAVSVDHTVTPEPFAVFFCLLGIVLMFSGRQLATPSRLLLAGASFGFAGSIRAWALLPAAVAVAACLPRLAPLGRLASGLILGLALPSIPFLLLAPGSFVHDVVVAPLTRAGTGEDYAPIGERFVMAFGLGHRLTAPDQMQLAWLSAAGLGLVVAEVYLVRARRDRLEWFLLGAAAAALVDVLFVSREFGEPDAYLALPFAALLVGVCVGGFSEVLGRVSAARSAWLGLGAAWIVPLGLMAFALAATALSFPRTTEYAQASLISSFDPGSTIAGRIPAGSCVVFDTPGPLIAGNRFISSEAACPALTDAYSLWLTENAGVAPPAATVAPAFVAKWRAWLERADYAVLWVPGSNYVPWTAGLSSWFDRNYVLVSDRPEMYLYRHGRAG
jgi:hypothetical protein